MKKVTYQGVRKIQYNSESHEFEVTKMYSSLIKIDGFLDTVFMRGNRHMTAIFSVAEDSKPELTIVPDAPIIPEDVEQPEPAANGQLEVDMAEAETKTVSALDKAFDNLISKGDDKDGEGS
jgi:hypothetical protein